MLAICKVSGFASRYEQETDERFNFDIGKTLTFYFCVYDSADQIIARDLPFAQRSKGAYMPATPLYSQSCLVNFFITGYVCKIIMYRVIPNMKCGLHI
jgi:hypothetical protein